MQNSARHVPKKRAPRKLTIGSIAKQSRAHIAELACRSSFDGRELRALQKHADFLARRVVTLELALSADARYSKQIIRKILALAGDARLV